MRASYWVVVVAALAAATPTVAPPWELCDGKPKVDLDYAMHEGSFDVSLHPHHNVYDFKQPKMTLDWS